MQKPKQKRSIERIKKILDASNNLLNEGGIESLTIAKISEFADLKRTSTYKFFETPDEIKQALIKRYVQDCNQHLNKTIALNSEGDYSLCLRECVVSIIEFFQSTKGAQKLILENTVSPPIDSSDLHEIAETILKHIEKSVGLPNMFNKSGVFLVVTQIIISILSLNTKENSGLTDVGLNEAVRAANAYLLSCIATPA
jgi:AcrR family transcriptional regulator